MINNVFNPVPLLWYFEAIFKDFLILCSILMCLPVLHSFLTLFFPLYLLCLSWNVVRKHDKLRSLESFVLEFSRVA